MKIERMHDIQNIFKENKNLMSRYLQLHALQSAVHFNVKHMLPYLARTDEFVQFAKEYDIDLGQPAFKAPNNDFELPTRRPYALLDTIFVYSNDKGVYTWCRRKPKPVAKPKERITVKEVPTQVKEKVAEVKPKDNSADELSSLLQEGTKPELTLWERFKLWLTA